MSHKSEIAADNVLRSESTATSNRQMSEIFQTLTPLEIKEFIQIIDTNSIALCDRNTAMRMERAVPYLAEASRDTDFSTLNILETIRRLYDATPIEFNLRNGWLYWLAVIGTDQALETWLDLISASPPECRSGIVWPFAPLLKKQTFPPQFLQTLLEKCLVHPQLAGVALDLLNYQFREGLTTSHAALPRIAELTQLLGDVANRLARIEEGHLPENPISEKVSLVVSDSVALLISLCDLVALCQYLPAEGKLRQTAELRHRRVQTEACAALAKLGIEDGRQKLIALAGEPLVRIRALAYVRELGLESQVDERFRTEEALAESHMANWLAEPQQMGIAPGKVEIVESRRQYWPGFDNPIDCHLVRFSYGQAPNQYNNIGIVGPMTYAFDFDVSALSFDDLHAAYAGWQAVHDDLYEVPLDRALRSRKRAIEFQVQRLEDNEFEQIVPQIVAHFFGEWLLVASAKLHGNAGTAIVDDNEVHWFIDNAMEANPQFAYMVYRGRRLLKTFNAGLEEA